MNPNPLPIRAVALEDIELRDRSPTTRPPFMFRKGAVLFVHTSESWPGSAFIDDCSLVGSPWRGTLPQISLASIRLEPHEPGTVGWMKEQLKHVDDDAFVFLSDWHLQRLCAVTIRHYPGTRKGEGHMPAEGPDEGYVELDFEEV